MTKPTTITSPSWQSPPEHLSLQPDEVHVWRAALDLDEANHHALLPLLAADERTRAERFRLPLHRKRFIAARGTLRRLLARYLEVDPAGLRFNYHSHGKPYLPATSADKELRFSVTHSEGLVLFAVTLGREVGIDLERIQPERARDQIAERFFSPGEVAALRALPKQLQLEGFFNCWTRKEAYVKARGLGLSIPLNQFDVSLAPGEPARLLSARGEPDAVTRWTLQALPADPGYVAALAVAGRGWQLRCWEWPSANAGKANFSM